MNILIDTHILLWVLSNPSRLNQQQQLLILSQENNIFLSQISLVEITIKLKLGKLDIYNLTIEDIIQQCLANGLEILPIKNAHLSHYQKIPLFDEHRDPFDRLLVATASSENLVFMSNDSKFYLYRDLVVLV